MTFFTKIFREPQDIHRVILAGILALLVSHFEYLYNSNVQVSYILYFDDYLFIIMGVGVLLFCLCWCVLSSEYNLKLYSRILIVSSWSVLMHRVGYGTSSTGSIFFDAMFVLGWSAWLPFAIMGWSVEEFMDWTMSFKKKNIKTLNIVEGKFNVK